MITEELPVVLDASLIAKVAKKRNMYETPELNECIYAHNLSVSVLGNLTAFNNVTTVCLGRNAIRSLNGIENLPLLKYLNVNYNLLECVDFAVQLAFLPFLEELHASNNIISELVLPATGQSKLRVLKLDRNRFKALPDTSCFTSLEVLDVSNNIVDSVADFDNFLKACIPKNLKQFYISPNTFMGSIKRFRQLVITSCRGLVFLDDARVTPEEIEIADAELAGGQEAVKLVRKHQAESLISRSEASMKAFREFQKSYDDSDQLRRELLLFVNNL